MLLQEFNSKISDQKLSLVTTSIKDQLQMELMKRGITAPITVELKEWRRGGVYFEVTSQPFQTVPVLFKEITVNNFNGHMWQEEGEQEYRIRFSIAVHASYTHFDGGSNGVKLFGFQGSIDIESARTYVDNVL